MLSHRKRDPREWMKRGPSDARGRRAAPKALCGSAAFQPAVIGIDADAECPENGTNDINEHLRQRGR